MEKQQGLPDFHSSEHRYREQSQMLAHFSRSLKELHRLSTGVYQSFAECSDAYLTAGRHLLDLPIGMILQRHGPRYSIHHIQNPQGEPLAGFQVDALDAENDPLIRQTWIGDSQEQSCRHPLAAHLPIQTAITTPIWVDQEVYGILSFVSLTAREMPFADYECEILELMARDLGRFMAAHRGELHRQSVESALRYSEMKYRSIFENITQGIFQTTLDGRYLNANPFLAQLYGYDSPVDLIMNLTDIGHQLYVDPQRRQELAARTQTEGIVYHAESQVYRRDRTIIWVSETQRAVRDQQGNLLYFEGTVEDITARRHAEEQLQYNAYHDPLTGLHNRTWFTEQLQSRLDQAMEEGKEHNYGVLFIDLDRFKIINDGLGHIVGDRLLQAVAQRLQETLPPTAKLARFGGDEFAVLLPAVGNTEAAQAIAAHLVTQMQEPIFLEQRSFSVGASVGIVLGDRTYQRPDQLLRDADLAMYRAKAEGGSTSALFEPSMLPVALARLELEHDLKRALELAELHLYYQPIFNLKTGELHSLEALVRWHHHQRGWIGPTDFIPVAEETGQIHVIGWWVLEQACEQLQQWRASHPNLVNLSVHVNVSVLQLKETDLVPRIMALLQRLKLPPQALKLEMTETSFLETANFDSLIFQEIQQLGIGFCIDDFGTGYSSLSRLHNLPINTIKVDRTFVMGVDQDPTKMAIAQTIINLAHNLGANVVSEGIESEAQHQKLQQLGCELGQGYWLSRPMDVATVQQLLNRSSQSQWIQGTADNLNHHNPELRIWV
ncbi:EAL domain-containing protein [Spirulina sp. CCNP1310]|uniref:putative bifunctional diguanylate cyclase/phosphodiesterase n=1 Tax=Spirulina sp. CCNP1310 TaxID=3110249 RepID=UPI002B1FF725|nr:EAL domain-containing protein [Spirulina sp. CCNP1310]MEA5420376.1 EAL domain-containing protein [Spirulina sp. CCNP1310]